MIIGRENSVTVKPVQSLPLADKLADDDKGKAWRKNTIDYYLSRSTNNKINRTHVEFLYKAAQGYLRESDYLYITNPNGNNKKRHYPARLRNYDIISPIINLLVGEYTKRPFEPTVTAVNSDITTAKEDALAKAINEQLQQMFINTVNGFVDTGFINKDIRGYEELLTEVDGIKDEKSIQGQIALSYIDTSQELSRKFREGFYDYLVTGTVMSQKGCSHNDVFYNTFSIGDCGYVTSKDNAFTEDGEAAWFKQRLTLSEIIDQFYDELTPEEITMLESRESDNSTNRTVRFSAEDILINNLERQGTYTVNRDIEVNDDKHEVAYVVWKTRTKLLKVSGVDVLGNSYEFEIGEEYEPYKLPNEEIEEFWVNETWHGWRIAEKLYKKVEPVDYQRGTMDNPSKCKLTINGRNLFGRHYYTKSPVEKILSFQEMYNIVHWQLEKTLNKNKDKVLTLPKQVIPDDEDMDMYDMLYFAEAEGFLFLDEVDPRQQAAYNAIKAVDLSLREYISFLYQLLTYIKQEAEETLGITRQRKGNTMASDLKGVNEQAIFQSAIISETLFLEYEEFVDRELLGLLDVSKYAWRKGKKARFVTTDKRNLMLDIMEDDGYTETEFSVRVGNGRKINEDMELLKAQVQPYMQNEGKMSTVAKIIRTKNIDDLINMLDKEEQELVARMERQQKEANDIERAKIEQQQKYYDDDLAMRKYEIDTKAQVDLLTDDDPTNDNDIKREELNIKREKIASDERIADKNNATALKNKVSGEN